MGESSYKVIGVEMKKLYLTFLATLLASSECLGNEVDECKVAMAEHVAMTSNNVTAEKKNEHDIPANVAVVK